MKFRIVRDYDEFQPQVLYVFKNGDTTWLNIGKYIYHTIEEARKVCADYKLMQENKVVEEFEL